MRQAASVRGDGRRGSTSLRDANAVTIPADRRPPGYHPGRFWVHVASETSR